MLDKIAICNIRFADCNKWVLDDSWRQTPLPPLRRRFSPWLGPCHDPAGASCYPEIGSALGISASAVGEFLRRAIARLKKGAI